MGRADHAGHRPARGSRPRGWIKLNAIAAAVASSPAQLDPRGVARQIVGERRFHPAPFPQPLRKPLDRLGHALRPVGRALRSAFDWLAGILPGGRATAWIVVGALVVGLTVLISRYIRTRAALGGGGRAAADGLDGPAGDGGPSRRELVRNAERAERAGDFDQALRLRFGAGLLALAQQGVIAEPASARSREVAATLRSADFDAIARSFDEVVYGGRAAVADDARSARERWDAVLAKAGR